MGKLELYAIIAVVAALTAFGWGWHERHIGYTEAKDEFAAAALKQADESRAKEQAERDRLLTVSTSYEQQIAQLKVDSLNRPARVVRLCDATATPSLPSTASIASESQSSPAAESNRATGRDIGGPIYDYGNDFKACAIQVNALIDAWPK